VASFKLALYESTAYRVWCRTRVSGHFALRGQAQLIRLLVEQVVVGPNDILVRVSAKGVFELICDLMHAHKTDWISHSRASDGLASVALVESTGGSAGADLQPLAGVQQAKWLHPRHGLHPCLASKCWEKRQSVRAAEVRAG
jgi:hypothetical protein